MVHKHEMHFLEDTAIKLLFKREIPLLPLSVFGSPVFRVYARGSCLADALGSHQIQDRETQ